MTLLELLDHCARTGIQLSAEGDRLLVRSPEGGITPELQERLRQHKQEILGRLRRSGENLVTVPRAAQISETRPLSLAQQSLWFLHRMDPATLPAYNIRKAFVLEGPLDIERWAGAFRAVVDRHETLRSSFDAVDGHPVARIASFPASVEVADLTSLGADERDAEVRRRIDEEGRRTFDLPAPPLFRASLLRVAPEKFVFVVNAHHLIADAWSAGLMLKEMAAIYDGRTPQAPATSYYDWVAWQQQRVASGELEPDLAYWKKKLDGMPALELPVDFVRSRATGFEGASESYVLPAAVSAAVRSFSAARGVTLFSTFLASFAAVLHRFSGQDDFPIGTSVAGRTRRELEDVIGFFADLAVLRMELASEPSFSELVTRVQDVSAESFEHHVPFDLLVKSLRPERVAGRNPFFQVLFLFLQSESAFGEIQVPSATSKFDLSLHVEDAGGEIRGLIEYKTALFERETIRQFLAAWLELLTAAVANPERRISELPIVTAEARRKILFDRNEVRHAEVPYATLGQWFEAQVERTPDRVAVKSGDFVLTYRELDDRASGVARVLQGRGVGPESRVGLLLHRSPQMIVAILGVLKAGGAYVPLDPSDPPARLAFVREDSGVTMVLDDVDALLAEPESERTDEAGSIPLRGSNAAYVIYTSGSTGQPRGVVVTHDNVIRLMSSTEPWFHFGEDDVWTLFHSYAFDFSVWEIWGALLYGGRVVIVPRETSRSPELFHRLLVEEGVTVLNQTPSAFRSLIDVPGSIPSLRYVIFGGEALDLAMLGAWIDRYGDDRPRLINMYGITETTVHVTWRRILRADVESGRGSLIGRRIPDLTLYILDERLEPVPEGVTGQLHVGGAGLSRGYLGRPELTADRFIPDPFSATPGARLYRTGDLARWRSGDIEYLGRCDAQVKIRGFRIEPGEIENALRLHAGVKECAVIAREDEANRKRLVAYYIPSAAPVEPAELRALCEQHLPSHMVPAAYVPIDAWPRTRNDKLDRARLPLPELDAATAKLTYAAPRNDTERLLCDIWGRALGVASTGIHDDFFALGGDSILSLEVLSQMRKHGLESSVAQLYRHHTVAELAAVVERVAVGDMDSRPFTLVHERDRARLPQQLADAYPLSQLQAGMLYEEQLHPEDALYHDIFSFHLRLPLDAATWSRVLQGEIDRHGALRTAFDLTHFSEPLQLVHQEARANCSFSDVSMLPPDRQEQHIARIVAEERRLRFEYAAPPLIRFHLVKRAEDRTQIIFGFHHAILDGWSVAVLFSRLLTAYLADLKLRPPLPAEPLPSVRHADYVAEERAALASDESFWKQELAVLPSTRLPRRDDAPAGPRKLVPLAVPIPQALGAKLASAARLAGAPLKTALLAAHLRVLGALTGQSDVVTGLVTNGRPEREGSDRILGLFLNTLPLHLTLGAGTFADLIRQTFRAEQGLLEHRRFPMAAVKQLAGGRTLFDAVFNFVHFHVYQEVMQTAGLEVLGHQVWEETDFPFLAQFSVFPGSSHVELTLIHDSAEFSAEQMERIAGAHLRCLEAMADAPESLVREHSLLSGHEHARLQSWGGRKLHAAAPEALHRWFEEQVRRHENRVAVRFEGEALSYRELDERANRLAHHLQTLGVEREALVGLCVDRSLDLVVGILGILKAGGAYVPLDPSYPVSRLRFIIDDSRAAVVVTHSAHAHLLEGAQLVLLDRDAAAIAALSPEVPSTPADSEQAAYVIYTSGSTGQPKGVVVTHGNVACLMRATESLFAFGPSDVWTLFHSYAFDFSVWEMWGALLYGGSVIVVPYTTSRSPQQFHRLLAGEGVTVLNQTPSAFYQLMEYGAPPSLRTVVFGGEALDFQRLHGWFERHGDERPQLINMYGITETTVHVTYRRVRTADAARARSVIGRPLPHLEALVLDEQREPVQIGVAGELYVGGGGVARGYLRRDELTAARFVEGSRGRLYRTGDLARWLASGELEYLGRIDAQIKIRGFRVELGEIENTLRSHGQVRDAAVALRGDRLVAYVVSHSAVTPAELRTCCQQQLPEYMVPAAYVSLESLPLTANGKLDRDALPDPDGHALPQVSYVAPRDETERQLTTLWEEVLGVPEIGVRHSFFELGGHSLHATQLIARVREAFALELPLRTLFEHPTVEKLAAAVIAQRGAKNEPERRIESIPLRSTRRRIRLTDDGEIAGGEPEAP